MFPYKKDLIVFGTAVAFSFVSIQAVLLLKKKGKKPRPKPPDNDDNWKLVGSLANLTLYPLKSGKGLDLDEADCTSVGLRQIRSDNKIPLRDRYFMLYSDDNGEMVTGKSFPNVLLISVEPETEDSVKLSYPSKMDLVVNIPQSGKTETRMLRGEPVNGLDCGDEAAIWLTEVTRGRNEEKKCGIRLAYWPSNNPTRNLVATYKEFYNESVFKGVTDEDSGAFSDITSYMLMTSSSMEELNRRLDGIEINPRQFRPNFYVQTNQPPFSDLKWKWVKIGSSVFRFVKGCKRCSLTTYDPETSGQCLNNEPLKTLKSIDEAKTKEPIEQDLMMGIHLGGFDLGKVKIGDPVYIYDGATCL